MSSSALRWARGSTRTSRCTIMAGGSNLIVPDDGYAWARRPHVDRWPSSLDEDGRACASDAGTPWEAGRGS